MATLRDPIVAVPIIEDSALPLALTQPGPHIVAIALGERFLEHMVFHDALSEDTWQALTEYAITKYGIVPGLMLYARSGAPITLEDLLKNCPPTSD